MQAAEPVLSLVSIPLRHASLEASMYVEKGRPVHGYSLDGTSTITIRTITIPFLISVVYRLCDVVTCRHVSLKK